MALLYGRTGRLTALLDVFRPGQGAFGLELDDAEVAEMLDAAGALTFAAYQEVCRGACHPGEIKLATFNYRRPHALI